MVWRLMWGSFLHRGQPALGAGRHLGNELLQAVSHGDGDGGVRSRTMDKGAVMVETLKKV